MIKTFVGGILVGMANIIPGVSGGTMMVILGLFTKVMDAISGLFTKDLKKLKSNLIFLGILGVGAVVGLVLFANLLEILFAYAPTQTLFAFVGMVVLSIPSLKKKEMKDDKFKPIPFILACALIFTITFIAPEETEQVVTNFPAITAMYLIGMFFLGILAGGAMFIPGVSGSMLMLIIGQYYLFKSLVAEVTSFRVEVLVPLMAIGVGIVAGVVLSSKLMSVCLEKFHAGTMNFIMGLIVSSSIALIPFNATYDIVTILTSILALVIGGAIVWLIEKFA